jgi:glycosyltransferase involved in cell wall biosynthesis
MVDCGPTRVARFLADRRGYYETIIVSRHHNMQRLRQRLGEPSTWGPVPVTIVGHRVSAEIRALASESVTIVEDAPDLTPFYDRARVFLAPSRYAAGIPLKIVHAAAAGVPAVCTRLLADQLGWSDGVEVVAADDAERFAAGCSALYGDEALWSRIRAQALRRVEREYSPEVFRASLQQALAARSISQLTGARDD